MRALTITSLWIRWWLACAVALGIACSNTATSSDGNALTDDGSSATDSTGVVSTDDGNTATSSDGNAPTDNGSPATDSTGGVSTDVGNTATDSDGNAPTDDDTVVDEGQRKSCKRGVAYGHHSAADMAALVPGVSWWYNWYFSPDSELGDAWRAFDIEFVPMRWGANYSISAVSNGMPSDAKVILGFNEPNFYEQANLSAADAAAMWPELSALADERGLFLVSPAVNFCGGGCHDTDPINYLNEFFAACPGCRVDAIAMHIYVECDANSPGLQHNRAQWLINHVEAYKAAFSHPLWLTEFACSGHPSPEEQRAFLVDAVAYLENEPRIARYAWFAGRADNMVNVDLLAADGALTPLGRAYVDAPYTPCAE